MEWLNKMNPTLSNQKNVDKIRKARQIVNFYKSYKTLSTDDQVIINEAKSLLENKQLDEHDQETLEKINNFMKTGGKRKTRRMLKKRIKRTRLH